MKQRLAALDWMRGLVMIIMVTDHASSAFNTSHPVSDSSLFRGWDQPLDAIEFSARWLSHLCAPVFLFLAGTSLALSIAGRVERGERAFRIDFDLLVRGALIVALELTFIDWLWMPEVLLLQVMYAIGTSFLLMIGLRRLPTALLAILGPALLLLPELTRTGEMFMASEVPNLLLGGFLNGGYFEFEGRQPAMVAYPVLPWCGLMLCGWVFGKWLLEQADPRGIPKKLLGVGAALLAVFLVVRGVNHNVGNLALTRVDGSLLQWLHVSKYPPSLTFAALELGIMFVLLAGLFAYDSRREAERVSLNPVLVFGQTALFFYLAHIALIELVGRELETYHAGTLSDALLASGLALVVLYPVCLLYRQLKRSYPRSLLRYV